MFISNFLLNQFFNLPIEEYINQQFKLLVPPREITQYYFNFGAVELKRFKDKKAFKNAEGIPTFFDMETLKQQSFKHKQTVAVLKTSHIETKVDIDIPKIYEYKRLESIVLFRYWKWIDFFQPTKVLNVNHIKDIRINGVRFENIQRRNPMAGRDAKFYYFDLKNLTSEDLIEQYNAEFEPSGFACKEGKMIAYHYVFEERFGKSPISITNKNTLICSNKIYFSTILNTIVNLQEN